MGTVVQVIIVILGIQVVVMQTTFERIAAFLVVHTSETHPEFNRGGQER